MLHDHKLIIYDHHETIVVKLNQIICLPFLEKKQPHKEETSYDMFVNNTP